jgi:hypothetical protein
MISAAIGVMLHRERPQASADQLVYDRPLRRVHPQHE